MSSLTRALVAALVCLAGMTDAAPGYPQPSNAPVSSRCWTRMGSSAVRGGCSTGWFTSYTSCVSTSTTTKTSTSTPSPTTSTITVVTTTTSTASTSTSTYTTTSTLSTTTTTTTTSTVTTTTTDTAASTATSTSTVPPPAGFTPIQTSFPGSSYSGQYGSSPVAKRAVSGSQSGNKSPFGKKYEQPQFVSCIAIQSGKCSTQVITITSTTQATRPTVTTTTTSTSTVTTVPQASTTVTTSTTTTLTSTSTATTTTTTATTTTITTTTSVYAACATNNFADTYNGGGLINGDMPNPYNVNQAPAANIYDCCVAAVLTTNANNFVFSPNQGCNFAVTDTCPNPTYSWTVQTTTTINYAYGNLGCGTFTGTR